MLLEEAEEEEEKEEVKKFHRALYICSNNSFVENFSHYPPTVRILFFILILFLPLFSIFNDDQNSQL
ncbi:hypothetical protein DERF_004291 [Dermatophagoides farinae]|uniref:Uncharacterized protein n=1 Tax=Dermatophagoides farinae TaxID=6954 RepID=A0A922I5S1_DERFA|nr:hypothetical protein DERF_004291 [Dermatophagoides farinae]